MDFFFLSDGHLDHQTLDALDKEETVYSARSNW